MIAAFSFLPHKELRFVIYAVPLLNVAAAAALESCWRFRRDQSLSWSTIAARVFVIGLLALSLAGSAVMASASRLNYPGGVALGKLHELRDGPVGASVWLSDLACQSGVTRFGQLRSDWLYSKEPNPESFADFTYLIAEEKEVAGFREIAVIDAFQSIRKWPFGILTKPALRVYENMA